MFLVWYLADMTCNKNAFHFSRCDDKLIRFKGLLYSVVCTNQNSSCLQFEVAN